MNLKVEAGVWSMAKNVADLMTWLPSIAIFGGLETATLERIVAALGEHHFKPGEEVCTQGESGRAMFLVRSGEVVVCRDSAERRTKMVRLGVGEFFGEMTLIDIQKRSATVVVEKPSLLFSFGNRDLYNLYQSDTAGYVMILQNLCRELSRRLRVTNERLQTMAEDHDDEGTLIRPSIKRL
jgi:CRP/FNR family transcriptional regulator, cyclic AMP receptor protein